MREALTSSGIEVAFSFVSVPRAVFVPSLLFLTVLKFGLVVLWFMHLRFDSKWFRRLFFVGLALAGVIFAIMGATFYFTGTSLGFG
jgi:cytochrome c oxidase subunit 4